MSTGNPVSALRLIPIALISTLLLAACSTGSGATPGTSTGPGSASGSSTGPVAASEAWAHVHNLTLDGDRLLIGTHEGLWSQLPGQDAEQVSEQAFDVMGFAQVDATMLSSGHPGEGQDAPADLGLQTSTDNGRTWTTTSLLGEVDFHRLRAGGTVVQGLSAHDGKLLRSTDSGQTWTDLGTPPLFDFALDPDNPENLIATQETGPVRSTDGGTTLTPIPDAPLLAFLAWTGTTLYAIDADGTLQTSTDSGTTWTQVSQLEGQPQALAADGDHVVALAGTTIWDSTDAGETFTPRITGIAGH
jgi:photosystem II stability/assembly factor-like uncharacterized protein